MFNVGQTFEGRYPPEAAAWCNRNNAHIVKDGTTYTIVAIPEPPPPTPEEIKKQLEKEVDDFLDRTAQDLGYRNMDSIAKYANSTNPKFKAEYDGLTTWCTDVYTYGYAVIDQVAAGERPIPTVEELFAELPKLKINYEGE